MLKKFYIEDYLSNKIKQEFFVLKEAVQGDITKHTLLQLFSMDNIKYLNQFLPKDHKYAEKKRMHILYDAMQHRDSFLKKSFEENFKEKKEKLKELFERKKEAKVYFTKDFEETIINHCARRQAWDKTLKEGQGEWWDSTAPDGGKQYQASDFKVDVKDRKATRTYKINLYLKEMVQRIEGNAGDEMGSDLSFPREDQLRWSSKKNEYVNTKRFNGMIIPDDNTIEDNYDDWLAASSSGLLSSKLLKHGENIDIEGEGGEEEEDIFGLDNKHQITFKKHDSLKNKNMLDVESVLINKEIRAIFQKDGLAISIIEYYGKPKKGEEPSRNTAESPLLYPKYPDQYINKLNEFIYKLLNLGNSIHVGSSGSKRLLTVLNTVTHDPKNPEQFFKDMLDFPPDEQKLMDLTSLKKKVSDKEKSTSLSLYKDLKNAVGKHGVIEIFDKEPYKKSFINFIMQRQFIKWIKDGNYKVKNPITGVDEIAEIKDDQIVIPELHVPTFKKTIVYYDPNHKESVKKGGKKGREEVKTVDMPVLLPGSILIEKGRFEEDDKPSSFGDVPKTKIGEEIWNPHEGKYEQRYYDKKKQYEEKRAAGLLTPNDLIGIQGTEDKTVGGQRPNHNIESFKTLCPDPEEKDNTFWNRINQIISFNGSLALCHFKPATSINQVPTVEFKELPPSTSGYKSIVETKTEFIVIKRIAEEIVNKLEMAKYIDSHKITPEKLSLMQHFPDLYHVIFAKIFSNLGNESMLHAETLDKFIQQKVQNYLDKDVANRYGRAGRIGNVSRAGEGEEKDSETPLPKGLEKVVSREVATKSIESYIFALHRNYLTLCKTGQSACGKCTDPIGTKCSIVMDEYLLVQKLEESIKLAVQVDKYRTIEEHIPAPAASEIIKAHKAAYKDAIYAEENASTKQEKEEASKKVMEIIKSVAKENGMHDFEAQSFLEEEHWEWRKQLQKTGMLKDAAAVLKSNPLILKNYQHAIKDGRPKDAQQYAVQLAKQASTTYEAAEEILSKANANMPDDDDNTDNTDKASAAPAPAPAPAAQVPATPVPAAVTPDKKLQQKSLFGDFTSKPKRTKIIKDPNHDVQDFVVQAKDKIVKDISDLISIKFANSQLHNQQKEEEKRREIFNDFMSKKKEALASSRLSDEEIDRIEIEMQKERDNQISLLSEEYNNLTYQLEVAKKETMLNLTNYFRHVDEHQTFKSALLAALQMYDIDIEEHIPAVNLKKYGLQ